VRLLLQRRLRLRLRLLLQRLSLQRRLRLLLQHRLRLLLQRRLLQRRLRVRLLLLQHQSVRLMNLGLGRGHRHLRHGQRRVGRLLQRRQLCCAAIRHIRQLWQLQLRVLQVLLWQLQLRVLQVLLWQLQLRVLRVLLWQLQLQVRQLLLWQLRLQVRQLLLCHQWRGTVAVQLGCACSHAAFAHPTARPWRQRGISGSEGGLLLCSNHVLAVAGLPHHGQVACTRSVRLVVVVVNRRRRQSR
jgi:hypothetical protein